MSAPSTTFDAYSSVTPEALWIENNKNFEYKGSDRVDVEFQYYDKTSQDMSSISFKSIKFDRPSVNGD